MNPPPADTGPTPRRRDLIALFVRHKTAANLLMAIMIIAGIFGLVRMNTQFFPDFGIDIVVVAVKWPGASADDVDTNIVQAIEPEVRFLDGVKRVRSSSFEGNARIVVEFEPGTNMQSALSNVETAVAQVTTLPEDSETPVIQRIVRYETLSRLAISGPYKEQALKTIAKRIRDDLLKRGIDKVDIFGARDDEIWVEIRPDTLRRLGLTLSDVAIKIRQTSQDVPSGDVSGRSERQIRSLGLLKTAREIGDVEVRSLENGQKIYLRDIAKVTEQFEEGGKLAVHNGRRALELHIQRAVSGDALVLANIVDKYIAELRPTLPPRLTVEQYDVNADLIRSRINLLLKNGIGGLVLVVLILFIFLNSRVAFFVALGIPISLIATMVVMYASGQTINMVSLFGLIMALGIIVDDAIVVGEHSEHLYRTGADAITAADMGARRMAAPVFSSSLTTIGAFLPLLLISDIIGQIIKAIPLVVIAVIVASLVECFLVLPGHMREAFSWKQRKVSRLRQRFNTWFEGMRDGGFTRVVGRCIAWRYATLATALAAFIISVGLIQGGRIGFIFFPAPEVDNIFGNVEFVAGTPRKTTLKMIGELERAVKAAEKELTGGKGRLVRTSFGKLGSAVGLTAGQSALEGDNVGGLFVQLIPTDQRTVSSKTFVETWRKHVKKMAGLEKLTIKAAVGGPPGRDVDVRLSGSDPANLKKAANEVRALLSSIPGVLEIEDDLPYGKRETILELSPKGKALGFTTESVGRQVRNAFEGAIAKRFARGDEEVIVRVQYPRGAIDPEALNTLYLRGPKGGYVPLTSVVTIREKIGFARIRREDGQRQVAITGDIDQAVANTESVMASLKGAGLAKIAQKYNVATSFAGRFEEQTRTFGDMLTGAILGLCLIYIVLAWVFASYARPLVIMAIIPLGFVGAVVGHLIMGFDLTILSMIAIIGLSGIVVNDSIILVTTINERIENGEHFMDAVVNGSRDRLRAVILTSATTIGGLTPLMFETDLQAQFLIPMAVTIVFGLALATMLVLVVVPALVAVQHDFGDAYRRWRGPGAHSEIKPAE